MLERIKGQKVVVKILEGDLKKNALPQTLLFFGPEGSGKFLTAVEVTRILNCENSEKPYRCSCPSCVRIRNLYSENMYIIQRSELKNTFDIWKLSGLNNANVRNFIFDLKRILYLLIEPEGSDSENKKLENNSSSKKKKFSAEIKYFEEIIREPQKIIEDQNKVLETIEQLLMAFRSNMIKIKHIEELQRFLNIKSSTGKPKVAIIDGAENMNEEASNRLLKISEEPPENAYLILITKNIDLLKETIKSRCIRYRFRPLSFPILKQIIEQKTGYKPSERDLEESSVKSKVRQMFHKLVSEKGKLDYQYKIIEKILSEEMVVDFLFYVIETSRNEVLNTKRENIFRIYTLETMIKQAIRIINGLQYGNLNPETSLIDFTLNYLTPSM